METPNRKIFHIIYRKYGSKLLLNEQIQSTLDEWLHFTISLSKPLFCSIHSLSEKGLVANFSSKEKHNGLDFFSLRNLCKGCPRPLEISGAVSSDKWKNKKRTTHVNHRDLFAHNRSDGRLGERRDCNGWGAAEIYLTKHGILPSKTVTQIVIFMIILSFHRFFSPRQFQPLSAIEFFSNRPLGSVWRTFIRGFAPRLGLHHSGTPSYHVSSSLSAFHFHTPRTAFRDTIDHRQAPFGAHGTKQGFEPSVGLGKVTLQEGYPQKNQEVWGQSLFTNWLVFGKDNKIRKREFLTKFQTKTTCWLLLPKRSPKRRLNKTTKKQELNWGETIFIFHFIAIFMINIFNEVEGVSIKSHQSIAVEIRGNLGSLGGWVYGECMYKVSKFFSHILLIVLHACFFSRHDS